MTKITVSLTGLQHHQAKEVEDCLIPQLPDGETNKGFKGSFVTVKLEDNKFASLRRGEHLALAVWCKGVRLGYIPELTTLQGYIDEANRLPDLYAVARKEEELAAVEIVRNQLFSEYDNDFNKQEWGAVIHDLLYGHDTIKGLISYGVYSNICQSEPEKAKGWHLKVVSIAFDW